MKILMSGNEAVARGAWEAGVHVASSYPGTPSTEILENLADYKEVYSEWAPNEKVGFEVASGASIAGARAMTTMKHVGLNVAADPLFTMVYTGVNGGFVVVNADDPGLHSSQNEQDNRLYAPHAKIPMIEASDSEECRVFMKKAFDLSEEFDTPVLFRMTTRTSHSKSIVNLEDRIEREVRPYVKDIKKYAMAPGHAKVKRYVVEERLARLQAFSNTTDMNRFEYHDKSVGIITSGISYQYAKEVFGENASYLKIGFTFPLPDEMIREFAANVEKLIVIEENEPYIEKEVRAMGISCTGKDVLPVCDELNPSILREKLLGEPTKTTYTQEDSTSPTRPPVLCAGCPHRGFFYAVSKEKNIVASGDIGCYTLGMSEPLNVTDTVICMGASISAGIGMQKAFNIKGEDKKVFSFIGDSTFFHSGITGLINSVYNNIPTVTVILDNRITAMTGHQENPGTGKTLMGEKATEVDIPALVLALGVKPQNIRIVNPYLQEESRAVIREAKLATEPFVIITQEPCALIKDVQKKRKNMYCSIDQEKCKKCKTCVRTGCPAIYIKDGEVRIDRDMCNGCTLCFQACPFQAIDKKGDLLNV